ncbi:hypothetical protein ACBZ91_20825 [Vibrio natriegens]|uniref:hypothetical protein n=1 Tax=Vibrio natriegens TaxID=691 RepID=UPI003557C314
MPNGQTSEGEGILVVSTEQCSHVASVAAMGTLLKTLLANISAQPSESLLQS